jgi:hypothetical protein
MSIRLELANGNEQWTFELAEAVIPSAGDVVDIDSPGGSRSFRVIDRRIVLTVGEPSGPTGLQESGLHSVGLHLEEVQ